VEGEAFQLNVCLSKKRLFAGQGSCFCCEPTKLKKLGKGQYDSSFYKNPRLKRSNNFPTFFGKTIRGLKIALLRVCFLFVL